MDGPIVLDYRARTCSPAGALDHFQMGKCLVDGIEIYNVWFADTAAGIVKTYDVFGDCCVHSVYDGDMAIASFPHYVETVDELFTITIHGKVELFPLHREAS
jgi:hypothetical protein